MISGAEKNRKIKKNLRFTGMKRGINSILAGIMIAVAIAGCSKAGTATPDDGGGLHIINNNDTVPPVVEIYTPVASQVFANGTSISITGKISDDNALYRGSIRITNDANGDLVKEQLYEIHGLLFYNFNLSHTVAVSTAADYTVTVAFEDHGLNQTSKSVKIKANP